MVNSNIKKKILVNIILAGLMTTAIAQTNATIEFPQTLPHEIRSLAAMPVAIQNIFVW